MSYNIMSYKIWVIIWWAIRYELKDMSYKIWVIT